MHSMYLLQQNWMEKNTTEEEKIFSNEHQHRDRHRLIEIQWPKSFGSDKISKQATNSTINVDLECFV